MVQGTTLGDVNHGKEVEMKLTDLDQPLVFAFAITFTVVGMMALGSWLFASAGWTGPLGLMKGGVQ